ncbi:DNA repair protein RecN [Phascolarctobacterium sp.]|uniref:DNA repair protein RecN n=1 Tax=Phascolarctobacterium sp. TaxID=2049039 RepID=UPI002A82866B|nr:DNA repair protein RecN [Phascolarctobacterium sp.]MDY5046007.1 DNA repair protein RecN [Phascolarctobacterium sp.]
MLQSLHVHNFALLEDAHAEFTPGFNVFTGETGAGKSILIDAFGMVLGGRASVDYVRSGTEGLWVQAVFDIANQEDIKNILREQGIEAEDDLFLKRQISAAGKSRALVNGVQVPLAVLKQIGTALVDIHGQHENQALLKPEAARLVTDAFGGASLLAALAAYKKEYALYVEAQTKLAQLQQDNAKQDLLMDRYAWEINEITKASLVVGEEEGLEAEARLLQNGERIIKSVNAAYEQLDEEDAVLSRLARVRDDLVYAARYDERLATFAEAVDSAWINLDDCRSELADYLSRSDFNEERATEVQQRLDTIYRLQKKYGGSTEAVLAYLEATQEKLEQLQDIAAALEKAQRELAQATKLLSVAAATLTQERERSAAALSQSITTHIHDLAMPNGSFKIALAPLERFTSTGRDAVRFLFSGNLGEPLNDLEKVASGGELSRIALAMKTVLMHTAQVGTMVFDEIDTGVGGVTAQKMAEKIAAIATVGQVLCITHLPQIAAFADNHIYIEKRSSEGRTATVLAVLDYNQRLQELVRMTAGASTSRAALESATELLLAADDVKKSLRKSAAQK